MPTSEGSLLDIGCGTGHFTRLFARETKGVVIGLDPSEEWVSYARAHSGYHERYVVGKAEELPFADQSFDCAVSVTALCFINDKLQALRELARVTRRRFVLGLLNRYSLLYIEKGRKGGSGGYKGAHWHTAAEIRDLMAQVRIEGTVLRTAVVAPGGSLFGRAVERFWPPCILVGGFLAVTGSLSNAQRAAPPDRRVKGK
jgi:ubiquinone/menaquinone biosynthesis C-methylase UbiE